MTRRTDGLGVAVGCLAVFLSLSWLGFIGWLLYTLAEWLITK